MQAFHYDTIDSTNEQAKRLLAEGRITHNAFVLAREQTAGRGTQGKSWSSPKDAGIYLSTIYLDADRVLPTTTVYTLAAGVACAETLSEIFHIDVRLKPINDLFINGCKLGGILTETIVEGTVVKVVITGVGINVRLVLRNVPQDAARPICLEELIEPMTMTNEVLTNVTNELVRKVLRWQAVVAAGDSRKVRLAWAHHKLAGTHLPEH